ncbi:MAG: uroporphyrinogen-III C-methyltransferase, partial [Cyanobacteria bacterium P01_A01_bin.37]
MAPHSSTETRGIVYLVGAGPGSIEYLTVRAFRLLQTCEVVVYDALIDNDLLTLVADPCVQIDVGKRGGKPSVPQQEINKILVTYCQQHKRIVRLKSGDPFIFGRCMAEIEALRIAGCSYEVVPGLSSALAAPLLAGIPLTDPVLSQGFSVVSAHQPDALNWDALAQMDTVVILMGTRHLD